MIYTVTFNPSLDYVVDVKTFKTGQVNRTVQEKSGIKEYRLGLFSWLYRRRN